MNEWARLSRKAKSIKAMYPKGTKVGLAGTVQFVDDIGQIHVQWENGRSLALNAETDRFRVTGRPPKEKGEFSR